MKKLVLCLFVLSASQAQAATQNGCWTSPGANFAPRECQNTDGIVCGVFFQPSALFTMDAVCGQLGQALYDRNYYYGAWTACGLTVDYWKNGNDSCVATYNATVASYNGLVSRLKKACGSRCRSVR